MAAIGRKALRLWRTEGTRNLLRSAIDWGGSRWLPQDEKLPLPAGAFVDASTVGWPPTSPVAGGRQSVGWLITPPAPASGGHTTIFRMVQALESAGHKCVLYLCGNQGFDHDAVTRVIRTWWPEIRAEVRNAADGMRGMDVYVATAWATAHVLAAHSDLPGRRLYFVQDFEPYFYPRGSLYALAEETYRFGFETITIGHMVERELRDQIGVASVVAPFGCDHSDYSVLDHGCRNGVVFYSRPGTSRRAFELGALALDLFQRQRPDVPIHVLGRGGRELPFVVIQHRNLQPAQLNDLYNRCSVGLALSMTNVSLVAFEMLAAGVIPVVNDWPGTRADLENPYVGWAQPTAQSIAAALVDGVDRASEASAVDIAASIADVTWEPAMRTVVDLVEGRWGAAIHAQSDALISTSPNSRASSHTSQRSLS